MSQDQLARDLVAGDRRALAKAITLIESTRSDQRRRANQLLAAVMGRTGTAFRLGFTGSPGVGKSSFIEGFGMDRVAQGYRVAVLAVDPSSTRSKGSILGDKTRMPRLASESNAFVRPSPSSGALGGVARRSRETMLLCEAAGYDLVIVETVGVGQSETAVSNMVDFLLMLVQPHAGDEMQGIKKGIVELVDAIVVNKTDGEMVAAARATQRAYRNAIETARPKTKGWACPVMLASALTASGMDDVWQKALAFKAFLQRDGHWQNLRRQQARAWFREALQTEFAARLHSDPQANVLVQAALRAIDAQQKTPYQSATEVVDQLFGKGEPGP